MSRALVFLVPALAWLLSASASANGAYTHVHISQLAHAQLPPGPLRDFLADPELIHAYEAGSLFPDSGYAVRDDYGELAHWEPFLEAYIQYLRRTYRGDYSSAEARRQVAFLLGIASHGMADQSYDTTLLARAFEVDGPEPRDLSVDQYADYFLSIDHRIVFTVEAWAPYPHLPSVIRDASGGHEVSEALLTTAMGRMESLTRLQSDLAFAIAFWETAWDNFPFLGTHVYNEAAVGSVPWLGGLVAAYWQVVWHRLHETDEPNRDLVIRTFPEDGAVNWPVDDGESVAWSRIALFFGYGVDREVARPLLTLRDAAGEPVEVALQTAYDGRERNLIFLVPRAPLDHDRNYTVEVAEGLATLGGERTSAPIAFSFRTRCADDRLDECPPLEPALVTGPRPMRPSRPRPDSGAPLDAGLDAGLSAPPGGGGCVAAPSLAGRAFIPLLVVAGFLGLRRRR